MATPDYKECYAKLQLDSMVSWPEVSAAHRKLVRLWHPDKYSGADKAAAQEHFIEFNLAYNQLKSYYKQHKELPNINTPEVVIPNFDNSDSGEAGSRRRRRSPVKQFDETPLKNNRKREKFTLSFRHAQLAILMLVGVCLLLLLKSMDDRNREELIDERRQIKSTLVQESPPTEKLSILE